MSTRLKTCFVGCGHHATWTLYPCFQYFPEVELAAVCDLDLARAESTARQFAAGAAHTDFRKMLDEIRPEALFCCGGPALHAHVIREALSRKLPLFVEKPPAPTAAETLELASLSEQAGVPVVVAFMRRFASLTEWSRRAVQNGEFGKLMSFYGKEGIWGTPKDTLVMDSGIHLIDLMNSFLGEPASVHAVMTSNGQERHAVAVTVTYQSGALGQLSLNSLEHFDIPNNLVDIHGDRGQFIRIENWSKATWFRTNGGFGAPAEDPTKSSLTYEQPWNAANVNRSTVMQGYTGEIGHFLDCIKNHAPSRSNLRDGWQAMRVVEAINQSIQDNRTIHFSEKGVGA
ncbi:Gfo/Idh/MocA family oxidoreductase [Kamptonema cortianum]|nr:Gfo/Idh/MocA family oxidoreductase [Oscillatoria laete-virens]MDK3157145.1 Gfo/Idh/MocA family oxidoreductase [Kamptonema cortianum]MDL5051122.1 Gfo/Idh/MocA family oxidoreductase [Oscillatoria amoena NRMC-F 0135]MDL5055028.1 Gfo/Idh/MocA family oxidoreductase [Oscillatoria laete-virens NRMC-F 0139]